MDLHIADFGGLDLPAGERKISHFLGVMLNVEGNRFVDEGANFRNLNRPSFTVGQNSRRIARYGTDTKEEDLEAVFTRVPRTCGQVGYGAPR
jgi:tricarballylate dehydrogenase